MKSIMRKELFSKCIYALILMWITGYFFPCSAQEGEITPLRVVVELNVGEKQEITLSNGKKVALTLVSISDSVDKLTSAIRLAQARVIIDGEETVLEAANYNSPVTVGDVQIDCPVTKAYARNGGGRWELGKDARFRLWPKGSPLLEPGTYSYPLKQRLLANDTQTGNEPVYVNGGEKPGQAGIYYHSGFDFGGSEGRDEVLSTVDGIVMKAGADLLPEYSKLSTATTSYDVVTIRDKRGWYHAFVHLFSIDPDIYPGAKVKMGQPIGMLGKEGSAGGWSHLHYSIWSMQPSGKLGEEYAFPYVWEAYVDQYKPGVVALARPHVFAPVGEKVTFDGSKSKNFAGEIEGYQWIFCDGSTADGIRQERVYATPGTYSEVLKVTNSKGDIDYDYIVVQVVDPNEPEKLPPNIHATYYPSLGIRVGDPVIFSVRTYRTNTGREEWDFGDGTSKVTVTSEVPEKMREGMYAEVEHRFEKPGHYLVRVERTNEFGFNAIAHLHVEVE